MIKYEISLGLDPGNTTFPGSMLITTATQDTYKVGDKKGQPKGDPVIETYEHKEMVPTGISRQVPKGLFSGKEVFARKGVYTGLGAVNGTFVRLMNAAKYDAEYLEPIFYALFNKFLDSYEVGTHLKSAMETGAVVNVVTGMPENLYRDQSCRAQLKNALDTSMERCEFGKLTFQITGFRPEGADIYALYKGRGLASKLAYWIVMDVGFGTLDVYGYDPEGNEIDGQSIPKLGIEKMASNYDCTNFDEIENKIHTGGRDAVPVGLLDRVIASAERLKTNIARDDFPVCLIFASGGGVIVKKTDKARLSRTFPSGVVYGNTFDNADAYLNYAIEKAGGV